MSSCVAGIQYDESSQTLTVSFVKGGSYTYEGVPPEVVEAFKSSGSQGKYFNYNIKAVYG